MEIWCEEETRADRLPRGSWPLLREAVLVGEFSRGKESIRASGGIVMVGNFDVDVEQQQRIGHLLSPLPPEMRTVPLSGRKNRFCHFDRPACPFLRCLCLAIW